MDCLHHALDPPDYPHRRVLHLEHSRQHRALATRPWGYGLHPMGYRLLQPCNLQHNPVIRAAFLIATACNRCGRPCPLSAVVALNHPVHGELASDKQACCWWTPPAESLTASQAARSTVTLSGQPLQGTLPTGLLRCYPCQPPPASPINADAALHFRSAYASDGLQQRLAADQVSTHCRDGLLL